MFVSSLTKLLLPVSDKAMVLGGKKEFHELSRVEERLGEIFGEGFSEKLEEKLKLDVPCVNVTAMTIIACSGVRNAPPLAIKNATIV